MIAPLVAVLLTWSGPSARATGLRAQVGKLYSQLETESLRLRVDPRRFPDSVNGPQEATSWTLRRDGGPRPGGTEAVTLVWTTADNPSLRRDWLQVKVDREELVPIAKGRIERGDRLDSSRVDWQWRSTTGMRSIPPAPDSLGKLQARTGISPGQTVWRAQLERLPLFHRGDLVLVKAGGRGASATVQAQAMDDGVPGSKVRLKSPWGKTLSGIAAMDGSVTVP